MVDDPNDADGVKSKANRDAVIHWWDRSAWDRVNNPITSNRIMVAQRTDKHDLIGHVIANHGFEPLIIPEEFEPRRRTYTSIGWTDPRTEEGQLLRPERHDAAWAAKNRVRPGYRTKYQQDPQDEENAAYKADYFQHRWRRCPTRPGVIILDDGTDRYEFDATACPLFAVCDPAASAKTAADNTALGTFTASPRGDLVWLGLDVARIDIPEQPAFLLAARSRLNFDFLVVEAVGANSSMFQFARNMGIVAVPYRSNQDKLVRSQPAIRMAASGRVWLPAPGVVPEFDVPALIEELTRFTGASNNGRDDRCDVLSMAVAKLPDVLIGRLGGGALPKAIDITKTRRMPNTGHRYGGPRALIPKRAM